MHVELINTERILITVIMMMMLMMIKSEAKCVSTHCVGVSDIYICININVEVRVQKRKLYYLFAMNNDESKKNEAIICHLMECTTPARPYLVIWCVALLEWQTIHFYNTGPCGTVAEKPNRHLTSKYI